MNVIFVVVLMAGTLMFLHYLRKDDRAHDHRISTRRSGDDGAHAACSCGFTVNASGEARWDVVYREIGRHLYGTNQS